MTDLGLSDKFALFLHLLAVHCRPLSPCYPYKVNRESSGSETQHLAPFNVSRELQSLMITFAFSHDLGRDFLD